MNEQIPTETAEITNLKTRLEKAETEIKSLHEILETSLANSIISTVNTLDGNIKEILKLVRRNDGRINNMMKRDRTQSD